MKKLKALFIVLVMVLMLGTFQSIVFADSLLLTYEESRRLSDDNNDGDVLNDRYFIIDQGEGHKVFKIGEGHGEHNEGYSFLKFSKALFCLRYNNPFGLGSNQSGGVQISNNVEPDDISGYYNIEYTTSYNMKSASGKQSIIDTFKQLNGSPDLEQVYSKTINGQTYQFTPYNSILWLVDNMAVIEANVDDNDVTPADAEITAESAEAIAKLCRKAGINNSKLTIDDVEVAQAMALWYFSNYDQNFMAGKTLSDEIKLSTERYNNQLLNNYIDFPDEPNGRKAQIDTLYEYLINEAIKNASSYNNLNDTVQAPEVTINSENASVDEITYQNSTFYKIGPFEINKPANTPWDINVTGYTIGYKNSINQTQYINIPTNQQGIMLVGNTTPPNYNHEINDSGEFFIAINKNLITGSIVNFDFEIVYTYSRENGIGTVWFPPNLAGQPVLQLDNELINGTGGVSVEIDNRKPDFALRKYITKVERNGQEVTIDSRVPNVDTTSLINHSSTTATYKHRKDAIEVRNGDKVTYAITVYNEGNLAGRVTEIMDHLPQGLTFDSDATNELANDKYNCQLVNGNIKVTITENYSLQAFNGGNEPDKYTIYLVFTVNATANNANQVLTNIAEITGYEVEGNSLVDIDSHYIVDMPQNLSTYWGNVENEGLDETDSNSYFKGQEDDDDFEKVVIPGTYADFALRKYITAVNGNPLPTNQKRTPDIDIKPIRPTRGDETTTAIYKHLKAPVEVKPEDYVTFTISVYNEGTAAGKVTQIKDYLPAGLTFDLNKTNELNNANNLDLSITQTGRELTIDINTDYTLQGLTHESTELAQKDIQIVCRVTAEVTDVDQILTNIAEITAYSADGLIDRDSVATATIPENLSSYWGHEGQTATRPGATNPNSYYAGQEDDDDFEKVIIKAVRADFALRKYIKQIKRGDQFITLDREPTPDTATISTTGTATYKHRKDAVEVKPGDIVYYNITVYNEGQVPGWVTKITDHAPQGLELNTEITNSLALNNHYSVTTLNNGDIAVTLEQVDDTKLSAFNDNSFASYTITLAFNVTEEQGDSDKVLTNIAEISMYKTEPIGISENDSLPNYPSIPEDLSNYWGTDGQTEENPGATNPNSYYAGREDDDDFEKIVIKGVNFDLALRKYISSVKRNGKEILSESREPSYDLRPLNSGTTASYTHPKIDDPLVVKNGDIITYTIRVYNEGDVDGYVDLITDHIPEGLEFITDSEINTQYLWEYESAMDLSIIKTSYWSKERSDAGKVEGLIEAYDGGNTLSYKDVEIEFKVTAPNTFTDNIVNIAEISASKAVNEENVVLNVGDRDNTAPVDLSSYRLMTAPRNSTYQEDDDDYEVVQLRFFDLALRKFITAVNDTEITDRVPEVRYNEETGEIEYVHPKTPVEVSNGDYVTYTIRVYNEGTIAGYAELVSDDIPAGLVYVPTNETNREFRWKMVTADGEETNNVSEAVRIITDYLSEKNGENMMDEEDEVNPNLINAYNPNSPVSNVEPYNPDFRDVKVVFQIDESEAPEDRIIINHAQITDDSDDDEDSTPDEWIDEDDDQDIENVYVRIFDLSLQKWVTQTIVTVDGQTVVTETGFGPNVGLTDQDGRPNTENEPIAQVVIDKKKLDSTVVKFVYAIRVANEGDIAGYATEITDYIPEGLMFVEEDNPLWTKVGDDKIITHALEQTLLEPGESAVLEVVFTWINNENNFGVKTNVAAITEDYNDAGDTPDIDSTPGNTDIDNYNKEQEDDDDYALVILTVKTGGEVSYIVLGLAILAIIATGAFFIKRFVL